MRGSFVLKKRSRIRLQLVLCDDWHREHRLPCCAGFSLADQGSHSHPRGDFAPYRALFSVSCAHPKNALARAVFFNRLGELRDRSFENQRYRASGLNLVVAAIVLWNTVYLGRAIHGLREQGQLVDENLLAHLSPLGWEHINLTGECVAFQQAGGKGPIPTLAKPKRFNDASVYATSWSLACDFFRFVSGPHLA